MGLCWGWAAERLSEGLHLNLGGDLGTALSPPCTHSHWQHTQPRVPHSLSAPNTARVHTSLPPLTPQMPCGSLPGRVQVLNPPPPPGPQPELRSPTPSFGPRVMGPSLSHSTNMPRPFSEAGLVWGQGYPGESDTTPREDPRRWGAGMAFRAGLGRVWGKDLPKARGFQVEKPSRGPERAPTAPSEPSRSKPVIRQQGQQDRGALGGGRADPAPPCQ